jgi:cobalamin-dependent methionine synthase I
MEGAPLNGIAIIGELINHSFARARRAWQSRDLGRYQELACLQKERGARFLTVNIQGTSQLAIGGEELAEFLPMLVPALQEAVDLPLSFDSPDLQYHRLALGAYDRRKANGEAPIVNSLCSSRSRLEDWIALVREEDTRVMVMASEGLDSKGHNRPNATAREVHRTARWFTGRLVAEGGRRPDQVIVDPGLCPIASDVEGRANTVLDALAEMSADPDLHGVHYSIGLTNFSFGLPRDLRLPLESAFLSLAVRSGLDMFLGNPEKDYRALPVGDPVLAALEEALVAGRPAPGESPADAGCAMLGRLTELWR